MIFQQIAVESRERDSLFPIPPPESAIWTSKKKMFLLSKFENTKTEIQYFNFSQDVLYLVIVSNISSSMLMIKNVQWKAKQEGLCIPLETIL